MELPDNIELKIVDYLNLEFSESEQNSRLNVEQLTYIGPIMSNGVRVWYWKFPCSSPEGCWATVEEYEGGYLISMTTNEPIIK